MCKEAAMPKPINKQQLLDEAQKKYEVLERQFASFTPEEMVRPGVIGTWSIKDTLAHLLEWQKMLMDWYEAGLRGETPVVPAEGYNCCLLYTSDAADDLLCVDLGGRRIIKKKKKT